MKRLRDLIKPSKQPPLPPSELDEIFERTRSFWKDSRGTRFFLTGGTGFFGHWLIESWARANDTLSLGMKMEILARDPRSFLESAPHLAAREDLHFVEGDVKSFSFPDGSFDHVIHAATTSARQVPARETLDTILLGTRRMLDFATASGARNLLFTSSGAVYGEQPETLDRIPEEYLGAPSIGDPTSSYGEAKRVAELMGLVHAGDSGFAFKIARCFAFVGPFLPLDTHFAIGNFLRDAMEGNPIQIRSNGRVVRSYLYAGDLATWLWTILFRGKPGTAYNVGSPDPVSLPELAERVSRIAASKVHYEILGDTQTERFDRYVPCTARARDELGLKAYTGLDESLRRTLDFERGRDRGLISLDS